MKKVLFHGFALVLSLLISPFLHAEDLPAPAIKFKAGLTSIVKAPREIYERPIKEMNEEENKFCSILKGLVMSPMYILKKGGSGVVDVATFPVADEEQVVTVTKKQKFVEGIKQMVTSPMEFYNRPKDLVELEEGAQQYVALAKGLLQAPVGAIQKFGDGFVNAMTFAIDDEDSAEE